MSEARAAPRRPRDVLMILPPDFHAPWKHLAQRFPPLGPAVVAASVEPLGLRLRAVDLALDCHRDPPTHDVSALSDPERVRAFVAGASDPDIHAVLDDLIDRIEKNGGREELVAVSVDRGSQTLLVAALTVELRRRWDARIVVGGIAMPNLRALLEIEGARGAHVVTTASAPEEIRRAFSALREVPVGHEGPPLEPNDQLIQLVRGGMRAPQSAEGWPLPDFSIYDLDAYRRDPLDAESEGSPKQSPLGSSLVLPYYFTFECQFSCAFCQTGGMQEAKPAELVARELAELAERWDVGEFVFFDTQINLHAEAISRALIDARIDLRWSDSLRVRPLAEGQLELMARAGCASITVGVESASPRVLKKMVKGHRPEHASEMIREAHAAEMMLRVNILTCFPGETRAELDETLDWVRDHATMIDDLAPSSFYLTSDSPIGRSPDRFGVILRGARTLEGRTKFRKSPDSLAYDEVGGLRWEEREPMLASSEEWAFAAWREGREGARHVGNLSPSTMLVLRRRFSTKAEAHDLLASLHDAHRRDGRAQTEQRLALGAKLVAPTNPALQRVLTVAFERALPDMAGRLSRGGVAHALLWSDGSSLFFRGDVTRGRRGDVRSISIEEQLAPLEGPAAGDDRAALFRAGSTVDLVRDRAKLGSVAVLSFRAVSTEGDAEDLPAAESSADQPADGRVLFLDETGLLARVGRLSSRTPSLRSAIFEVLDQEAKSGGALGQIHFYLEAECEQACEFCEEPQRRRSEAGRLVAAGLRAQYAAGDDLVSRGAVDAILEWMHARPEPLVLQMTGHDWLRHPHREVLFAALERNPGVPLRLQGPSLDLESATLARRVAALPHLDRVATTVQSSEAEEHDAMVGRPGAHVRLAAALETLQAAGVRVRPTVVLTRRALRTLPETLAWLRERGLGAELVAFEPGAEMAAPENALAPLDEILEALESTPPDQREAIGAIIGVPPCAVPSTLRGVLERAPGNAVRDPAAFGRSCATCASRPSCPGVPRTYLAHFGERGLAPLDVSES